MHYNNNISGAVKLGAEINKEFEFLSAFVHFQYFFIMPLIPVITLFIADTCSIHCG